MKKTVLAFGNPVYDLILTPHIKSTERLLSGCSTNACLALTKMGEKATLVGMVGSDFHPRLRHDLEHWGIKGILSPSSHTGGFRLMYDQHGDRELSIIGVADPIPIPTNGFRNIDFVLIGPILGETSVELVMYIRANIPAPILLDPQGLLREVYKGGVRHRYTRAYERVAELCTIVKANELETHIITGINPRERPESAVRALGQCGCKIAIVTLAEMGSVIFDGNAIYTIPPFTTNAIDPTGAGDTFAAGFIVKYVETPEDLSAVGCFASAVASIMVEYSGPEFPLSRAEVERRTAILLAGPQQLKLSD